MKRTQDWSDISIWRLFHLRLHGRNWSSGPRDFTVARGVSTQSTVSLHEMTPAKDGTVSETRTGQVRLEIVNFLT